MPGKPKNPNSVLSIPEESGDLNWVSALLHRVGTFTSLAIVGLTVAILTVLWLIEGFFVGFASWWDNAWYTVTATITLVMVFVIQHTESRHQAATQRKLDELLRALPSADNRVIAVETAPDQELDELAARNRDRRERAADESSEEQTPPR